MKKGDKVKFNAQRYPSEDDIRWDGIGYISIPEDYKTRIFTVIEDPRRKDTGYYSVPLNDHSCYPIDALDLYIEENQMYPIH